MKTAFQRPKAGSYETGDKMSLTHHKQIDKMRPRLDVRSETPFQFCLSHAVMVIFTTQGKREGVIHANRPRFTFF